jgi:acyl carrier protein
MDAQRFLAMLNDLFELAPGEIDDHTTLQQIPGWDSLTFLGLIARIDEEYGVAMAPDAVTASTTVAELRTLVERKAADRLRAA